MMYSFAKPEAVRSFREAWKRDPDCAICYWGEAWAWGSYLNAADERRGSAARLCRGQEGDRAQEPRDGKGARVHRRDGGALRREVRPREARRAGQGVRDAMARVSRRDTRTTWRPRRCTPTRCSCSSRGAARATSTSPTVQRLHHVLEQILVEGRASPGRLSSLRPRHRIDRRARHAPRRAPSFSASRFPARATSTTCRRTPGTKSADGAIRCAPTSRRGTRI